MKRILFLVPVLVMLIGMVTATSPFQSGNPATGFDIKYPQLDTYQLNHSINFNIHLFNSSNGYPIDSSTATCYLHIANQSGFQIFNGTLPPDTNSNIVNEYDLVVLGGNFSTAGNYGYTIQCNDSIQGGYVSIPITVTPTGEDYYIKPIGPQIILISFFILLLAALIYLNKSIDFERWYERVKKEITGKNPIRKTFAVMTYSLMKNVFVFYYLLGLMILFIVTNISYAYNLASFSIMKILLTLFMWGSIFVAISFFGRIIHLIMDLKDHFVDWKWGGIAE